MRGRPLRLSLLRASVAAASLLCALALAAQETPMTLEEALAASRQANVRLPIPALDLSIARERVSEARAERWLKVAVEGVFLYAPANGYDPAITNAGEFRLQAVGRQTLYDGGARRAAIARSEAEVGAAAARYRIAEKDLELEVRSRFSEFLQGEREAAARRDGLDRLARYRTSLESRRASGQGVAADLLKIDVRLATERASLVDALARRDAARLILNDLMGRDPAAALSLIPLAAPSPPGAMAIVPPALEGAAEVVVAAADARAADADVSAARAERRPHLNLTGDVGFLGSDTSRLVPGDLLAVNRNANLGDRVRRDAGYSFMLSLAWPVWDFGAIRSRIRQAELRLESARLNVRRQQREVARQRAQARATLESAYEQIRILSEAAPSARDSYLEAESRYRGGAATAFEVLDAYTASVDAAVRLSDAISRYRIAEAVAVRWSEP